MTAILNLKYAVLSPRLLLVICCFKVNNQSSFSLENVKEIKPAMWATFWYDQFKEVGIALRQDGLFIFVAVFVFFSFTYSKTNNYVKIEIFMT